MRMQREGVRSCGCGPLVKKVIYVKKRTILCLVLAAVCLLACACGANDPEAKRYAFLSGAASDSFSEEVWSGLMAAANAKPCTATAYTPEEETAEAYADQVKAAKKDGAKLFVCAGSSMRDILDAGQKKYKKLHFVLIEEDAAEAAREAKQAEETKDGKEPKEESIYKNTCIAVIAPQDAGYLVGYALVTNGNTKLGFMGGEEAVDAAYASGFIQGAERAAADKALAAGSVTVRLAFTGSSALSPATMDKAMTWYDDGTDVIYAPQSGTRKSVIAAAELTENGRVAASGIKDVSSESARVIMTAVMSYPEVVKKIAADFENDSYAGGERVTYGVLDECVYLSADYASLTGFTDTNYSLLMSNLSSGQARIAHTKTLTSETVSVNVE